MWCVACERSLVPARLPAASGCGKGVRPRPPLSSAAGDDRRHCRWSRDSRANAQARGRSSSPKTDRGLSVAQSPDFFLCLLFVLLAPRQHRSTQFFEANTSRNNLRVRWHSWKWGPATGPQNNPQGQVPEFPGQLVDCAQQRESQNVP